MLSIYTQNKQASFGFLGATIIKGDFEEAKQETKRFTVYKSAVIRLFGVETFTHHRDSEHSTYLMVNNRNKDIDAIKDKAKKMFEEIFPSLDS